MATRQQLEERSAKTAARPPKQPEKEDFPRPDATTAAQGTPTHEQHARDQTPGEQHRDDRAHGFSEDSGYKTSGGYGDAQSSAARSATREARDDSGTNAKKE